jgi:pimeloyl-ACP methyl ester carboxylesterase
MKRNIDWIGAMIVVALPACGGGVDTVSSDSTEAPSSAISAVETTCSPNTGRPLVVACERLAASLQFANTVFTSATSVGAGELKVADKDIPAHCLLTGKMDERVSPVDGSTYSIGFEMRLPLSWNRRFFYQANGGTDGNVTQAIGVSSGGGALTSALLQGFAVISSDAGHNAQQNPSFGIDPQARLDYGYQAVGKLTPMAKNVLRTAYGQRPAYSYIGGCSNGGRHTMVAAARYADQYDGYLVGSPGFNLPEAAVASIYGAQQYATVATPGAVYTDGSFAGLPDISGGFNQAERQLLSNKVLEKCDALDGLVDGMVHSTVACQSMFRLSRDVPTCPGPRDGTCLTTEQKVAIGNIFAGAKTSAGVPIYSRFPFDTGHATSDVSFWEFISPLILDSGAVGLVFGVPPANPATFVAPLFALTGNVDQMAASIYATDATYTESAQSFMVPPDLDHLRAMRRQGGRMLVYHGASDPIFSADDSRHWYENLDQDGHADGFARLYLVPGMGHCAGGPSADQFDLLTPLVRWVERGDAPTRVVANVRGLTNPGGPNFDVPSDWSPNRSRPLCAYPGFAVYNGGDIESADSFVCRR